MSVILTNGATQVIMRDADFQVIQVPPWETPTVLIDSPVGLPRAHTLNSSRSTRLLTALVSLELSDRATTAQGLDSLMSFFEGTDYTGVDGMNKTFMLTDADGVSYQVRFADNLAGGLREGPKNQFNGTIQLINEHTLPTDEATGPRGWWAAWDMENNGGDMSNWSNGSSVGGASTEWSDKSGNGYDGSQLTAAEKPTMQAPSNGNAINNRWSMNYDGADDNLGITGDFDGWTDGLQDQPFTCYAVFKPDVITSGRYTVLGHGNVATAHRLELGVWDDGGSQEDFIGYIDDTSTNKTVETNADLAATGTSYIVSYVSTGTALDIYVNGDNKVSAGDFNVAGLDFADPMMIGAVPSTAGSGHDNEFDGRIGEIVFFTGQHTALQRRRQEYRLSDMWGIDLTG